MCYKKKLLRVCNTSKCPCLINLINILKLVFGDNTLVAQCVLFLMVGYDTTASTLAFSSFLMAKHPQHQQRLRQELNELLKEYGSITYEGIMEAKFLDAVLMGECCVALVLRSTDFQICIATQIRNWSENYGCVTMAVV